MEITPHEAVRVLRQRIARTLPEEERRAAIMRARLPGVVEVLVRDFGIRRIVLFGSLARGVARAGSDIDLAVEGLASGSYFAALVRAEQAAETGVDLVPLEEATESLRRLVETHGEVLHDDG